jgi:hypothetical protein
MASVIALTRPSTDDPDRTRVLEAQVATLIAVVAEMRGELDALKPPPRFTIPPGWLTVKRAAALCGFAEPTVSEWARKRKVTSLLVGGRRYIDPSSLPPRA